MTWQDVAVACIVLGALVFLGRKIQGFGRPSRGPSTFIPISRLRKRPPQDRCH